MPAMTEPPALALARDFRLASFGRAGPERIREPLVEPQWTGLRVVAAAHGDDALLLDDGVEVEGQPGLRNALARATARTTEGVILEAFVTKYAVQADAIIYTGTEALPSTGSLIARSMVGSMPNRTEDATKRLEADMEARDVGSGDPVNLVAVDLLWLDGEWLLDVPLAERKRLLESVLPGDDLVRTGPYVRPPIQTWVGSWRAQGFPGITYKAANSRYRPGQRCDDWASSAMPRR
jgi:bifunctional non-homologous end joining protein LigD